MEKNLHIKIIVGSTRENRFGIKAGNWIFEELMKNDFLKLELLDLKEWPLPFYDEPISPSQVKGGAYPKPIVRRWAEKIEEADAFILVSPEYNHSTSAVLKNALDSVWAEWNKKPVGFVSYGSVGGARAIEHLRGIAVELQMASIRNAVHIREPWNLVNGAGDLKPGALDDYRKALESLLKELLWWANALKSAREKEHKREL